MARKHSLTPDIESQKVVELVSHVFELAFVLQQVGRWMLWAEEVLTLAVDAGIEQDPVEVLVQLRSDILHQELDLPHKLSWLAVALDTSVSR